MKHFAIAAFLTLATFSNAFALTIPSGSVLSTNPDGTQSVVGEHDTHSARLQLENKGFHVGNQSVRVSIGEHGHADISIHDIRNANGPAQLQELISEAVRDAIQSSPELQNKIIDQITHAGELGDQGISVRIANDPSLVDSITQDILNDTNTGLGAVIGDVADKVAENIVKNDPDTFAPGQGPGWIDANGDGIHDNAEHLK